MDVDGLDREPGKMSGSVRRYLWKWLPGLLMAMVSVSAHAQTVEYIHTDALGTPVAVTNSAGVVIERSEYEPYGLLLNRPIADGPGFTGHVQDAATGLTYMQQRYYDPGIGRFLSVDPVTADSVTGANFNRYWYANNNPYKFTDPDGRIGRPISMPRACLIKTGQCFGGDVGLGGDSGSGGKGSTANVLRRHKTPKSQAKLIESVGGDPELLEYARESHQGFVNTLIGLITGGGLGGGASARGTTTLYRAVSEAEAASIRATGKFSAGPNSLGGKWFAETLEHAKKWGDLLNGKGASRLLEVKLPKPTADQLMRLERLDSVGPARYGELNQLEQAVIREVP